ncbi:hypothetical protein IPH19_03730 [Candidatus Uhrbacteria bacterium]|nr:MAG: hypothetical protein IPH19_03730 [Candidatus Uhrbacteria bacterium]
MGEQVEVVLVPTGELVVLAEESTLMVEEAAGVLLAVPFLLSLMEDLMNLEAAWALFVLLYGLGLGFSFLFLFRVFVRQYRVFLCVGR